MAQEWLIVGAGRCGLQLARSMLAAGIEPRAVVLRHADLRPRLEELLPGVALVAPGDVLPAAEGLLIAVPDDAIGIAAAQLARRRGLTSAIAVHTSGLRPAAILGPLAPAGCSLGSLHPLVSFPEATGPLVSLSGVTAAVEGEEVARRHAASLATRLGMAPVELRTADKPLYHAAASVAANLTHALVVAARELLEDVGFDGAAARAALAPLVHGSIEAAIEADGWDRLTGAIARADAGSVSVHLAVLPDEVAAAYRAVAALAVARLGADGTLDNAAVAGLMAALTATG